MSRCTMAVNGSVFAVTFNPVIGWIHLVVVYLGPNNGQGLVVNVNSTEVGRDASGHDNVYQPGNRQLFISRLSTDSDAYYSSVVVDELTLWNRELTALEIEDLYQMFP